jgi:hypothetical protein
MAYLAQANGLPAFSFWRSAMISWAMSNRPDLKAAMPSVWMKRSRYGPK